MCNLCDKSFASKQKIALHQFKKHGIKAIERKHIVGSRCPICLVEFWSRERAINHVRYRSMVCRENILMYPPALSMEEADALDELDKASHRAHKAQGRRRHFADKPCIQAHGPFRELILDPSRVSLHHPLGVGRNYV